MSDWARVANTTIRNYFRDVEVNILRNRKLTGMLEQKGRFKFNASGLAMNWPVRYKRVPMQGYTDSESLTFPRHNRWKKAELDWRGYTMSDSCTSLEREKNK